MPLVKVKRHCQITLPANMRRKFKIDEGDYLEIDDKSGSIVLKPVRVVHQTDEDARAQQAESPEQSTNQGKLFDPFNNTKDGLKKLHTE